MQMRLKGVVIETTSKHPPIITLDDDDITEEDDGEGDICADSGKKEEKISDSGTCIQHISIAVCIYLQMYL